MESKKPKIYKSQLLLFISISVIVLLGVSLLSLSLGDIPFSWEALCDKKSLLSQVVMKIRLPRVCLACIAGGSLSLAGLLLQGVYRNPLVEPFTMGVSGGAALGVAICLALGIPALLGSYILPIAGGAGALLSIFLVYFLSMRTSQQLNVQRMVLIGVMVSFLSSSVMMFIMAVTSADNLQGIIFWTMGSLNEADSSLLIIYGLVSLTVLLISYAFTHSLNALRLGFDKAKHLGVNAQRVSQVIFILASLLTGMSVALTGIIGFVGLVIPHLVKRVMGSNYRLILLVSYLWGSIFLVLCDMIARTVIVPNELPIGVITGIVGGGAFLFILSNYSQNQRA